MKTNRIPGTVTLTRAAARVLFPLGLYFAIGPHHLTLTLIFGALTWAAWKKPARTSRPAARTSPRVPRQRTSATPRNATGTRHKTSKGTRR